MKSKDKKLSESVIARRKRRLHTFMFFLIIAGLVSVCLFTPFFSISSITVGGNTSLTDEQVVTASAIKIGSNVFRTNMSAAEKKLKSHSRIKTVTIKRKFPARVFIQIEEYKEFAYIKFSKSYIGISDDGSVIKIEKNIPSDSGKPIITGITLESYEEGTKIKSKDKSKTKSLVDLMTELKKNGYEDNLSSIDVSDESSLKFITGSELSVIIGKNEKLDYKMAYLEEVLKNIGDDVRGATVDLSDTSNVIYKGGE